MKKKAKQNIRKRKALVFVLIFSLISLVMGCSKQQIQVKEFSAFFTVEGTSISPDNDVMEEIAKITGAKCYETWLTGQTKDEAINQLLADGDLPDFISGEYSLYKENILVPLDDYIEKTTYLKDYFTKKQWDSLRQSDGHIYWIPQFHISHNDSPELTHSQEAFWIQTRVLKWAGYPEIRTIYQYFALIEKYIKAHPDDGYTGFLVLCDDWRGFCLENPPQFLDGYPNDGSCIVDPVKLKVMDYNVTPTAKAYFKLLNEEYKKGIMDPESFTLNYLEYLSKLGSGKVLGMVDQWWQFYYPLQDCFSSNYNEGINYVPLPITISEEVENQWHTPIGATIDIQTGIAITTGCSDVEGAVDFVDKLLSDEVMRLRYWGIEEIDYSVGEDGNYYITPEQYEYSSTEDYGTNHRCYYSNFPRLEGISEDGKNAYMAEQQPDIFFNSLPDDVRETFKAYGCETYVDMLGNNEIPGEWYPLYTHSDTLKMDSEAGVVWENIKALKQRTLPSVIMSEDFELAWNTYMKEYNSLHPEIFIDEMQRELLRRVKK